MHESLAHRLPGGIQAQGHEKAGGRCRPGSLALGVGQLPVNPHALGGHQCEQRGPDLKHNDKKIQSGEATF